MKQMRIKFLLMSALFTTAHFTYAQGSLLVIAPHPDDAESCCGALMLNHKQAGDEVRILTLTQGERGIGGVAPDKAREIRMEESRKAAAILGVPVEFMGEMDGDLKSNWDTLAKLNDAIDRIKPSIVVAPWPLDIHPDHQATSLLTFRAWLAHNERQYNQFALYYYPTTNSKIVKSFHYAPTHWINASAEAMKTKGEATAQNVSQGGAVWFDDYRVMNRAHGREVGVSYAEPYLYVDAKQISKPIKKAMNTLPEFTPPPRVYAPANLSKYHDANAQLPPASDKRVVMIGDSITEGWVNQQPEFFQGRDVIGRGISGETTRQMFARFDADVIALKPHTVVILAGTNDIAGNEGAYNEKQTFANIKAMAERARKRGIRVVLCSLLPVKSYPWSLNIEPVKPVHDLNVQIKQYAKANQLAYVDYFTAMHDDEQGLPKKYADDGVHPNAAGYAVMGELLNKALLQEK